MGERYSGESRGVSGGRYSGESRGISGGGGGVAVVNPDRSVVGGLVVNTEWVSGGGGAQW